MLWNLVLTLNRIESGDDEVATMREFKQKSLAEKEHVDVCFQIVAEPVLPQKNYSG